MVILSVLSDPGTQHDYINSSQYLQTAPDLPIPEPAFFPSAVPFVHLLGWIGILACWIPAALRRTNDLRPSSFCEARHARRQRYSSPPHPSNQFTGLRNPLSRVISWNERKVDWERKTVNIIPFRFLSFQSVFWPSFPHSTPSQTPVIRHTIITTGEGVLFENESVEFGIKTNNKGKEREREIKPRQTLSDSFRKIRGAKSGDSSPPPCDAGRHD